MKVMVKFRLAVLLSLIVISCAPKSDSGTDGSSGPGDRPNIIFILTDDQRWDAVGYAGNDIIYTPNMDKLAQKGVYFSNAFVTTPICAASRASIFTGMYERTHNYTFGTPPLAKKYIDISYAKKIKDAGYYTGFFGKLGVSFENKLDTSLFDESRYYRTDFYYRLTGPGASEHIHLTDLTGNKVVEFIEGAPSDKPFCLSVSFNAPHAEDASPEQYIWPERLDSLYKNDFIPYPEMANSDYFEAQPEYVKSGLNRLRWKWRFDTPEKYQKSVKGYYRMISAVDENIGRIIRAVEDKEIAGNTIIMMMGDNGYFLGERGLAGKWLMYENSLRVPLLIYDPRTKSDKHCLDQIALNIDIAPTILDYADVNIPDEMQGKSLRPLIERKDTLRRTDFLCEHLFNHPFIPQSEGIRTEKWKYFRYRNDPGHEELYNLKEDPAEKDNLSADPVYKTVLDSLRGLCDKRIIQLEN